MGAKTSKGKAGGRRGKQIKSAQAAQREMRAARLAIAQAQEELAKAEQRTNEAKIRIAEHKQALSELARQKKLLTIQITNLEKNPSGKNAVEETESRKLIKEKRERIDEISNQIRKIEDEVREGEMKIEKVQKEMAGVELMKAEIEKQLKKFEQQHSKVPVGLPKEKDLLALFSRPGAGIASGAVRGKGPLELKVAEASPGDVGRTIVRMGSEARKRLGVAVGDVVELEGRRTTAAVVWAAPRQDEEMGIIRMDGYLRQNAGVELGDSAIVRRAKLENARRIVLAPQEPTRFAPDFEAHVKKRLVGRALAKGDTIYVRVFSTSFPLIVVAARPDGIALVTEKTELELREGPVVPANWLFEAAARLKNAKTASCGRCYGSAFNLKLLPARKTFWIEAGCRACKRKTSYILDFHQKSERLRISQLDKARIPFEFLDQSEDIGYGTAHNTGEFVELLRKVPAESLEYHSKRGDFARWLEARDEDELASGISKAGGRGEALRQSLMFNLFYKTEKGEGAGWKKEKKPVRKQAGRRGEKKKRGGG